MKKQFFELPQPLEGREMYGFSWLEHVTAIPAPLVLVTSLKDNGKPNATLQSWLCFTNDNGFYCVFGNVNKHKHMYSSVTKTKQLVINFPSADVYKRCYATIANNRYEDDELYLSGLTAMQASTVRAPLVKECFLNIECVYEWEKELYPNSDSVVMCVRAVNVWMDEARYSAEGSGRYGDAGYLYNIHSPINPETCAEEDTYIATIKKLARYEEL